MASLLAAPTEMYIHLTATRYTQIVGIVLLSYDYLLTLDSEVKHFWKGEWTWTRFYFFANRYFAFFAMLLNIAALFSPLVTDKFIIIVVRTIWARYFLAGTGTAQIYIVEAILISRLRAMYWGNKPVLYSLLVLFAITSVSSAVLAGLSMHDYFMVADLLPGFTTCAPPKPAGFLWAYWIPVLLFEASAFALAASKACLYVFNSPFRSRTFTMNLLEVLLRDSVVYFLCILLLYIAQILVWRFIPLALDNLLLGPILSILPIIGSRMMINLREIHDEVKASTLIAMKTMPTTRP